MKEYLKYSSFILSLYLMMVHSFELKEFTLANDHPFVTLDAKEAFQALTQKEQLYAHYLSKASFMGSLIVLLQTSPESPTIYRLLQKINNAETPEELRTSADRHGVDEESFDAFLVYSSGFLSFMGNYKSFGDLKIVPKLCQDTFEKIVLASAAFRSEPELIRELWESVRGPMYSLEPDVRQLGLGNKGVTTYFSSNCNQTDAAKVKRFLQANEIEGFNNRALKTVDENGEVTYEIRHSSVKQRELSVQKFEESTFKVTTGDYGSILSRVIDYLEKAKEYAGNDLEVSMLDEYIKSFTEGSLAAHKEGSKYWVQNKNPNVETYLGFIETYRDPVGQRAEFEGFVAMVNKAESEKFQTLVANAEQLLSKLPWPKEFEKDVFLKPDFTSLDVLTFAGSGLPAGINIPNYNEIRQTTGFKNVNLGNVVALGKKVSKDEKVTFVSEEDGDFLRDWTIPTFKVKVALHELLGHGSGKLFFESNNGSLNYDPNTLNPLTNEPVTKHYGPGDTYLTTFASIATAMEECRADAVALYMVFEKEVAKIFGHEDEADDLVYATWLSYLRSGLTRLVNYRPESKEWKQAHSRGAFAIIQVLLEAGNGFIEIQEVEGENGEPDLLLTMDKSKLESVGRPAIGRFLQKLQIYKSIGDFENAFKMFGGYTKVSNNGKYPFAKWREIISARSKPRKLYVQSNTVVEDDSVTLHEYDGSTEGALQSWRERFSSDEDIEIDAMLRDLAAKDAPYFKKQVEPQDQS